MNMAAHPVTPEEIMALFDTELSTERAGIVATHLTECDGCAPVADSLRSGSKSLASWTVPTVPVNAKGDDSLFVAATRIASERRSMASGQPRGLLGRNRPLIIACSGAFVLILLFVSTIQFAPRRQGAAEFAAEGQSQVEEKTHTVRAIPTAPRNAAGNSMGGIVGGVPGGLVEQNGRLPVGSVADQKEESEGAGGSGFQLTAPMIARTISLSIVAKDFGSSRAALDAILARHHGYAASLTANTQQNTARSLQASLRIPAAELNAALAELKALGQVQSEGQNGEEVTRQHADLVARLKNSRETERRLQAILEQRTGKISDVLAVEQEIARVRGEIEQMEAEQKSLEHRVSFASVDLTIIEEYKAQINPPSPAISTRVHNALVSGYRDAVETLVDIVLFFASYGPSLLIWLALLAPIVWVARRRWQRLAAASSM